MGATTRYDAAMTVPTPLPFPPALQAAGTAESLWEPVARLENVPMGAMRRATRGDLDILIAHTDAGLVATEDRCPHMSAPLSAGSLEGCELECPLHRGRFDLRSGDVITFPSTGGLEADGTERSTWTPAGSSPKPPASDSKASARALTRVRRVRYFPLRVRDGQVEIRLPR
jgi:nitrite reductase/ring-hydroxylating ferredoxin subunit